jgi:hypothetical protein
MSSSPLAIGSTDIPAPWSATQARLFHRDRQHRVALLPSAAPKSPVFDMLGHILDSLIT